MLGVGLAKESMGSWQICSLNALITAVPPFTAFSFCLSALLKGQAAPLLALKL